RSRWKRMAPRGQILRARRQVHHAVLIVRKAKGIVAGLWSGSPWPGRLVSKQCSRQPGLVRLHHCAAGFIPAPLPGSPNDMLFKENDAKATMELSQSIVTIACRRLLPALAFAASLSAQGPRGGPPRPAARSLPEGP